MKWVLGFYSVALAFSTSWRAPQTDGEIREKIVGESIANFRGDCPCPYSGDRAGKCGKRSAYSRSGGASPICYADDVTQQMIDEYRRKTDQ